MEQQYFEGMEAPAVTQTEPANAYSGALEFLAATPFEDRCQACLMALLLAGVIDQDQFDNFSLNV